MSRIDTKWGGWYSDVEDEAYLKDEWKRAVDAGRFDIAEAAANRIKLIKQEEKEQ